MTSTFAERRRLPVASLLVGLSLALATSSGCAPTPEGLTKKQISNFNALADALEGDGDKAKIESLQERIRETQREIDQLNLSAEDKAKLLREHSDELGQAAKRVSAATIKRGFSEMGRGISQGLFGQ